MSESNFKGYTVDEIIALARGKSYRKNEAQTFFQENKIREGNNNVDVRIVYWKYLLWCASIGREPVPRKRFVRYLREEYKVVVSRGGTYCKLNKEDFAVSRDEWFEIIKDYNLEKRIAECRKKQSESQRKRRRREARKRRKEKLDSRQQKIQDFKRNSSPE